MHKQSQIIYPQVGVRDVFAAFWRGMRPQWVSLFFIIASIVVLNILSIVVPIFYKNFFDILLGGGDNTIIAQKLVQTIITIALLHGIIWALYRVAELCNNKFQPYAIARLRQQAYEHLMGHSHSFFAANFVGSLTQSGRRFGRAFERLADDIIWNIIPTIVRIVSIAVVLWFVNKWIDAIIILWIIIFLAFNIIFSRWKLKYDIQAAAIDSKSTGYLADTITNHSAVSLFANTAHEKKGYKSVTDHQAQLMQFTWNLDAIINGGQAFLGFAIEFILFYIAIRYWKVGLISVGVFALLQAYAFTLIEQLWGFTRLVRDVYQSYADAKEMVEIMALPHEITDTPTAKDLAIARGQVDFQDVSFNFRESRTVLQDINLTIEPGEKVALVGPSGAGKTTLVRLLLKIYLPTEGCILIDDQNIAHVTQDSLHRAISLVPQDPVLFHRTLAENIGYGKLTAGMDEIKKAATLAHCDEFIKVLPHGFNTYVGERGVKLSGGERQRVAIARAILKNAPILVLDEATSSLDSHSEMLIQDALNVLMKGRTTIVIAHRLSTIQKMDRIVVVDNGKIVEQGSHAELLAQASSLYKKLWTLQAGGFLTGEEEEKIDEEELEGEEKFETVQK